MIWRLELNKPYKKPVVYEKGCNVGLQGDKVGYIDVAAGGMFLVYNEDGKLVVRVDGESAIAHFE